MDKPELSWDNDVMAKRKSKHLHKMIGVHVPEAVRRQLETLANRNLSSLSEEIRRAVIAHLEKAGLWPTK